jgi:hypothetical protein
MPAYCWLQPREQSSVSSETSLDFYRTMWRRIPKFSILHCHWRENIKYSLGPNIWPFIENPFSLSLYEAIFIKQELWADSFLCFCLPYKSVWQGQNSPPQIKSRETLTENISISILSILQWYKGTIITSHRAWILLEGSVSNLSDTCPNFMPSSKRKQASRSLRLLHVVAYWNVYIAYQIEQSCSWRGRAWAQVYCMLYSREQTDFF